MIRYVSARARYFAIRNVCRAFSSTVRPAQKITLEEDQNFLTNGNFFLRSVPNPARLNEPVTNISVFDGTIYALSTAPGRAGIAVVRVSGPHCLQVYRALCPTKWLPRSKKATICQLHDPLDPTNIVDSSAVILYFPSPRSVTGEDVLELHIHGGPATQKAVLAAISNAASVTKLPIRYAEPGEFTRRAFQNDKLDLAQVEALSDALSAETEQQRRAAVRGQSAKLGEVYEGWRHQLLYARGELEALIDFSEDQHFDESPSELLQNVAQQVDIMLQDIKRHETASHCGELLKRGIRISLLGPPNAGKSSLLNEIVGREASIVSNEAGTTRDIVEVSLDIRGYLCTIADTAGLRMKSSGAIELEGIKRAKAKASESDVVIAMASLEYDEYEDWYLNYDKEAFALAAKASSSVIVLNKAELAITGRKDCPKELILYDLEEAFKSASREFHIPSEDYKPPNIALISCVTAQAQATETNPDPGGIKNLISHLVDEFKNMTELPVDMEDLIGVTERQRQLLATCSSHLLDFKSEAERSEADIVLAAEHLRFAATCLARITGRGEAGDVEEVLGVVFEKFCVGK